MPREKAEEEIGALRLICFWGHLAILSEKSRNDWVQENQELASKYYRATQKFLQDGKKKSK